MPYLRLKRILATLLLAGTTVLSAESDAPADPALADPALADPAPPEPASTDSRATDVATVETWYRIDVGDTPAGWMLERLIRQGDRLTTVSILELRFQRGSSRLRLELESRFVETLEGRPIAAWSRQTLGLKPVETTWEFQNGGVLVEVRHDGETRRERMPSPPGEWLTPGQAQTRLRQMVASGTDRFSISSLEPELGLEAVDSEWLLDARGVEVLIDGQPRLTNRYRQRPSMAPHLETTAHLAADGAVVRSVTSMMGLEMTVTLATREQALASREAPDLLVRSFIYPDRPIHAPRRARRAIYELHIEDGPPLSLPSAGGQRVLSSGAGTRVAVELGSSPTLAGRDRPETAEYLRPSTTLDY